MHKEPSHTPSRRSRGRGTRGAVLAEFIIAFMPIMTIYMSLLELSHYFVVREVLSHGANIVARSCAVIGHTNQPGGDAWNGYYGDPQNNDAVEAGKWALKPWMGSQFLGGPKNVKNIKIECTQDDKDPYGEDYSHITADYTCSVPIAKNLVCSGGAKKIDIKSSFPHQGAKYVQ